MLIREVEIEKNEVGRQLPVQIDRLAGREGDSGDFEPVTPLDELAVETQAPRSEQVSGRGDERRNRSAGLRGIEVRSGRPGSAL
jgi:hypothetical protein